MSQTTEAPIRAIFDVGSNSVRLLVATVRDGQVFSVYREKITTRLLSGFANGRLSRESLLRTAQAIELLARKARDLGAVELAGFGTSAMRDGENRQELIDSAGRAGVSLRVLTGEEEAEMAYAGAAPQGSVGVVDIGGGSTELLAGNMGRVLAATSARVGAVRLWETLGPAASARELVAEARTILEPHWDAIRRTPVDRWIGVGGTITTLAAMKISLAVYDPDRVQGVRLTKEAVCARLEQLQAMDLPARRALPGLSPERADIIPCGAAILAAFFQVSGVCALEASDRDNLSGFALMLDASEGARSI